MDEQRGDLPLDDFIIKILDNQLKNKDRIDFSKYMVSKSGSEDDELAELEELDDNGKVVNIPSANINQSKFLEDFKDFAENIYARLDRLEGMLSDQETILQNYSSSGDSQETYYDPIPEQKLRMEHTVPESGEVVIFEEMDADEYDPTVQEPDAVEIEAEESDDEFEYGCPFCSATISEDATECPSCGNRFDDRSYDPSTGHGAVDVRPLSEGYSDSGPYDPRPEYLKHHEPELEYGSPDPVNTSSDYNNYTNSFRPRDKIRLCEMCGNKLSYVKSYKRWYCFSCKRYEGTLTSSPDMKPPASKPPTTSSGESSPILSSATPTKHSSGAPSGFRDLYTPRPEMESMPPVKPRRNPSTVRPEPGYKRSYQAKKKPLKDYPVYDD